MTDLPAGRVARARAYYRALDGGDYDLLAALLAPGFVHERPDRTLEGADRFVRFMREDRPRTDTAHPVDAVYERAERADGTPEVAVRGRLVADDGTVMTGFLDVFTFDGDDRVSRLRTYVD